MKYRIVESPGGSFYVHHKFKWWPFWFDTVEYECSSSLEEAHEVVEFDILCRKGNTVVWEGKVK